jgi:hypothetical protein
MYPPFLAPRFLWKLQFLTLLSDLFIYINLGLFHMLFLGRRSTAESWTRTVLLPKSAGADDLGTRPHRTRKRSCQSGGPTCRLEQVSTWDRYESRRERPFRMHRIPAARSSGTGEALGTPREPFWFRRIVKG